MWLVLSVLCAVFAAASDLFAKRSRTSDDPMVLAAGRFGISLPFLWAMLPFIDVPPLASDFWPTLGAMVPFEILAGVLYVQAIRVAPLSLTLPLLAFTPAFVVLSGIPVLGERLQAASAGGVVLVCLGAYLLHLQSGNTLHGGRAWLAPVRALFSLRGSRLMLAVAAIYSFTSVAGKKAVLASSPPFFVIVYFTIVTILLLTLLPVMARVRWRQILKPDRDLVLAGICQAAMVVSHAFAIVMVQAAFFMAIKRTSILFGVLLGWLVFKEAQPARRFLAALVMAFGVAVILLTE